MFDFTGDPNQIAVRGKCVSDRHLRTRNHSSIGQQIGATGRWTVTLEAKTECD